MRTLTRFSIITSFLLSFSACGGGDSDFFLFPDFDYSIQSDKEYYAAGDEVTLRLETDSLYDLSILDVEWSENSDVENALLLQSSSSLLSFALPAVVGNQEYEIVADVTFNGQNYRKTKTVYILNTETAALLEEMIVLVDSVGQSDFADTNNADGFLHTDDASNAEGVFKWDRSNERAYNNISAPIAKYLWLAGLEEAALIGFEAMYNRSSADPSDRGNFNSWDLGVFLFAFEQTQDFKYLEVAFDMWPEVQGKYGFHHDEAGSGSREPYWGYDSYGMLLGFYYANKYAFDGAPERWALESASYEAGISAAIAQDFYHFIHINLIDKEMGIGEKFSCALDAPETFSCTDFASDWDVQGVAYAVLGDSCDDVSLCIGYLKDNIDDADLVSESSAEALAAMRTFYQ